MKTPKHLILAGAISVFSLSLAFGQQQPRASQQQEQQARQQQQQQQQQQQAGQFEVHRATDLKGSRVVNQNGDRLGTLEDLVIEIEDGVFSYAIVAAGGFLGIGADWRPVPPEALQAREAAMGIELMLDITEDQWEQAPTIEREQIERLAQETRGQEIYQFYGKDWEQRQQRLMEFAAPPSGREEAGKSGDQAKQIQQKLEDAMTQAGAEQEQAEREAERLAQQFAQEEPDADEIEEQLEKALTRVGVDEDRARQEAEQLSQQVHQQIEFAAPQREQQEKEQEKQKKEQQEQQQQQQQSQAGQSDQASADQKAQQIEQQVQQEQQTQFGAPQRKQQAEQSEQKKAHLATDLRTSIVVNEQQEEIGEISDFLVSLDEGRVAFVLFTEDTGVLSTADEEYAVAPRAIEIRNDQAVLNITQQELEQAQALTRQQLPMQARQQARSDVAQARQSPQVFRYQEGEGGPGVFGSPARERDRSEASQSPQQRIHEQDAQRQQRDEPGLQQPPPPSQQE